MDIRKTIVYTLELLAVFVVRVTVGVFCLWMAVSFVHAIIA